MRHRLQHLLDTPHFIWTLLALPAFGLVSKAAGPDADGGMLLHVTGELSVRLLVLTLLVTPLAVVFSGRSWTRWLRRRRRWFGVASALYALLHLAVYAGFEGVFTAWSDPAILTGWLALVAFLPPLVTSTDRAVRSLGRRWKPVQQLSYAVAVATIAHWVLLDGHVVPVLVHFAPWVVLRLWAWRVKTGPAVSGGARSGP